MHSYTLIYLIIIDDAMFYQVKMYVDVLYYLNQPIRPLLARGGGSTINGYSVVWFQIVSDIEYHI